MTAIYPKTPDVFAPLWESRKRYLAAYGGRGSGKSWDRGLHLIVRMIHEEARAVCVREVQNSIKDSVHQLLIDTIQRENVGGDFSITETEIKGPGKSQVIYKGMKDLNAESVKSLEGFDIAWWEEAQSASGRSFELLRPTLRKPGSQLWFTWNPRFKNDPVDKFFRQGGAGNEATVVKANWDQNPFFTEELELERNLDLNHNAERYPHIWEGAYETESDMLFITGGMVQEARKRPAYSHMQDAMILGVDVARFGDDRSVIQPRRGNDARTNPAIILDKLDTMQLVGRVTEAANDLKADAIFVDEGGVGSGVVDRLHQLNMNVVGVNFGSRSDHPVRGLPKAANKRAEMWAKMREALRSGLAVADNDEIEVDLTGPTYVFNADNAIQLEKKEEMKKRGVRSPDMGDALALTYAYPVVGRALQDAEEQRIEDDYDPVWGN